MKKIAFHLNCLERGGAERVVSNLANRFAADGYEVYVATEWQGEDEFELDPRVTRVHVGLRPEDEKRNRAAKFLRRIKYLKEFAREVHPDVLVAFAKRANFRALTAVGKSDIPVVISIRINPIGWYDSFTDQLQIKWLFPRGAGCVYQTEDQKKFFAPYLQEKSRVIFNPINPKYFGVQHPEVKEKAVMHHARLQDFKNQPMLVRAFLKVHDKHPDYVLRIFGPDAGDGTKETLEKLIKDNNAENFVFLMGSSDSLEKELPKGEVYAYSSDYEGMPNSLLEAMALGMPCVSTDCPCGGPRAVIEDGVNGFLIPVGDEDALADRINRLIEDKELAKSFGEKAREIEKVASTEAIYQQWKEYLEQITDVRN